MTDPVSTTFTAVKIGHDVLKLILTYFKNITSSRKEKDIVSKIYKELLLGDKADAYKIKSWIVQLEQLQSTSPEAIRAMELSRNAKIGYYNAVKPAVYKEVPAKKAGFGKTAAGKAFAAGRELKPGKTPAGKLAKSPARKTKSKPVIKKAGPKKKIAK